MTCSTEYSGSLSGSGGLWSSYSGSCNWSEPGEEHIYTFTPSVTGTHSFSATVTGDPDFFLRTSLSNTTGEVDCWSASKEVSLTAGTTYYLIVDNYNSSTSTYSVSVTCPSPTTTPTVTTTAVTTYDPTSATMGGNVTDDGGATVTECGVVYSSSNSTPTIGGSGCTKQAIGSGTGSFSQNITGLTESTIYYVRAYATNSEGTSYGDVVSFHTLCPPITITDESPWTCNFDSYSGTTPAGNGDSRAYALDSDCWDAVTENAYKSPFVYKNYVDAAFSGSTSLEFKSTNAGIAILPEFSNSLNELNLTFKGCYTSESGQGTLDIGYYYNGTFTSITSGVTVPNPRGSSTNATGDESGPFYFTGTIPSGSRIAIKHSGGSGTPSVNLDDIVVSLNPTLTFGVSPSSSGNVSVTLNYSPVASGVHVVPGASLSIAAAPVTGYSFSNWTVSGTGASVDNASSASTTLTMGTANTVLTANFEPTPLAINKRVYPYLDGTDYKYWKSTSSSNGSYINAGSTYAPHAAGSVSLSATTATAGSTVTITTTPKSSPSPGYKVLTVYTKPTCTITTVSANSTYEFTMPSEAVTVYVVFAPNTSATAVTSSTPWTDGFDNMTWGNADSRSFTAYSNSSTLTAINDNGWALPLTVGDDGTGSNYTRYFSPRFWSSSTGGSQRRLSFKCREYSEVMACLPEFSNNLNELMISFDYFMENNSGTLQVGYYNCVDGSFTSVQSWSLSTGGSYGSPAGTKTVDFGTVATTLPGSQYRIAFYMDRHATNSQSSANLFHINVKKIPYEIANIDDWNAFCAAVNAGHDYSGETVTVTQDVGSVSNPITTMAGYYTSDSDYKAFAGTFDGGCHTLYFNLSAATANFYAPFGSIYGGTIQDLKVDGTINGGSYAKVAGLVGHAMGTSLNTISNCQVGTTLRTTFSGDASNSGVVARLQDHGKIAIRGCAFTGAFDFSSSYCVAGFVGWCPASTPLCEVEVEDCLFAPTSLNYASDGNANKSQTFVRSYNGTESVTLTLTNCYYTTAIGTSTQGKEAHTFALAAGTGGTVSHNLSACSAYNCSGITPYSANGLGYDIDNDDEDEIILGSGDAVRVTATPNTGYSLSQWSDGSTTSTSNPYDYTMTAANTTLTATFTMTDYTITYSPSSGSNYVSGVSTAHYNDEVTVTITMASNWVLGSITAKDASDNDLPLSGSGSTRTFTMPASNVTVTGTFDMIPVAVPFSDDFESGDEWQYGGGYGGQGWVYGEAAHNGTGTHGIYISNGSSGTYGLNNYSNSNSGSWVYYAYKTISFESEGEYIISYDWRANGETTCDYLRVALAPINTTLTDGTKPSGITSTGLPSGWISADGGSRLNLQTSWNTKVQKVNVTAAATYKLVFVWVNDYSNNYQPPAAIDNVKVEVFDPPYTIADATDWDYFAKVVNLGYSYSGETVTMTEDVGPVTTMVGTNGNSFQGTFDGGCHTLSVNLSSSTEGYVAPFHYVIGATIENLTVTGSCVSSAEGNTRRHNTGLVGNVVNTGVTINNCLVNVNVGNSTYQTDYCGGLIGHGHDGNITITGSAYTGTLYVSGTNQTGGLVGWSDTPSGVTISNCLFAGTYTNSSAGYIHPVGCALHGNDLTAANISITNCYYDYIISASGSQLADSHEKSIVNQASNKGTRAYTVTATSPATVALDGTESCIGITTATKGIGVGSTIYGGSGETLSLLLGTSTPVDYFTYSASTGTLSGTATEGSDDPYTLQMTANNSVITANILKNHIASTSSDTQMTWAEFATAVTGGQTYSGKTVYLDEDVNGGNNPVGTSTYPFQGTFDGGCNTLTVGITNNNQGAAPFQYIKGATIQNLHVTGTVSSSAHHTGGLVGFTDNEGPNYADAPLSRNVYIRNCHVSTSVSTSGGNYNGGIIGHAKCVHNHVIGCVYDGTITTTGYTGGIIGWSDRSTVTITDTYFNGTYSGSGGFHPIGCKTHTQNDKNVTVDLTISNCYYNTDPNGSVPNNYCILATNASETGGTWTLRDLGKHGYTLTLAASPLAGGTVSHGSSTATYSCSGITAYATGIDYDIDNDGDDDVILGNGESATLTATANTGYTFMNWTDGSTPYINNPYAVTMGSSNRTVTANFVNQTAASNNWVSSVTSAPSGYTTDGDGNVTISDANGLAWLISKVNALNGEAPHPFTDTIITLTADVNMSDHTWVPIGTAEHPFTGTFNGNGHVITGITRSTEFPHNGLFGYVNGSANIQNVVVQANLTGNSVATGAVVGTFASTGTISNVEGAGTLTGGALTTALGGIAGNNTGGTIHSSFAVATLTGNAAATQTGGLVGNNTGSLYNSYSNATYSGTLDTKGGLAGTNSGTIANCYAAGIASGVNAFAGTNSNTIQYCYANSAGSAYAGGTAPTDHGTYSNPQSSTKHLDYMYRDNLIALASGTSNTYVPENGTVTYNRNHTPVWNGLVSALNQWVEGNPASISGLAPWYRPISSNINGDLPVLGFEKDNSLGTLDSDGKFLQYGSNQNSGNGLDAVLATYSGQTASIFHYGKATGVANVPTANVKVSVAEDAVLLQDDSKAAGDFINTTVGVTFDNSDHGQHAYDYWGNKLNYDWHLLSTPLSDLKTGAEHSSSYTEGGLPDSQVDITSIGGYFPDDLITSGNPAVGGSIKWDFYTYYEPEYHWINLKRSKNNHIHQDGGAPIHYDQNDQDTDGSSAYYIPGKGYEMAISQDTYMNATGTLNRGDVPITLTNSEPDDINYAKGWNLVGNPYQAYLDISKIGYDHIYTYDADQGTFVPYTTSASANPEIVSQYIHPHQAFFVHASSNNEELRFTQTMATTDTESGSYFRDDKVNYPLVNLFAEDGAGHRDLTVIEFHRPELGGAPKLDYMRTAPFSLAAHYAGKSYGILFATDDIERVPVKFKPSGDGLITLTWITHNGEFSRLLLVDNKLGVEHNMLADDSYTFMASPDDYSSRFYIVYECSGLGIDDNDADGAWTGAATFAYINNGNIVIDVGLGHGASLQVIDVLGRVLYSQEGLDGACTVSTNGLAKGVYILRLSNNQGVKTQKIVVQ